MNPKLLGIASLMLGGVVLWSSPVTQAEQEGGTRAQVLAILKKLETIEPFRCTSVATVIRPEGKGAPPLRSVSTQIWQKGPYFRSEPVGSKEGMLINRPEGFFIYSEAENGYTQTPDFAKEAILQGFKLPPNNATGVERIWADALESPDLQIIGTEAIDGKEATVISYTTSPLGVGRDDIKLWLWNEKGLMLKEEKTTSMNDNVIGTEITEWKDFVFEEIPDSLFEVPQDQIQKLPEDWHP